MFRLTGIKDVSDYLKLFQGYLYSTINHFKQNFIKSRTTDGDIGVVYVFLLQTIIWKLTKYTFNDWKKHNAPIIRIYLYVKAVMYCNINYKLLNWFIFRLLKYFRIPIISLIFRIHLHQDFHVINFMIFDNIE